MITNGKLVMRIRGLGNVPAFKNKKIIAGKRLITAPKARRWMEQATQAMYSKLSSYFQTTEDETSTVRWQQSAMSWLPSDDNWKEIPMIKAKVRRVKKGEEGCIITLTKISNKE